MIMRLDKFCASLWWFTRNEAKSIIRKWAVHVNGESWLVAKDKIEIWNKVGFYSKKGELLVTAVYKENYYAVLYKEKGYISADEWEHGWPSYRELMSDWQYTNTVHVAWRLDQDTEWLLIVSSDWTFIHSIISPKKNVSKLYYVECKEDISDEVCAQLASWVTLENGTETKPSRCTKIWPKIINLELTEGRFHQVKRMMKAVKNEVIFLRRESIWNLNLEWLKPWEWKEFSYEEIDERIFGIENGNKG